MKSVFSFMVLSLVMNVASGQAVNITPPAGPAPSVNAEDTGAPLDSIFIPGLDAEIQPSHPPIDQIPPMPMPSGDDMSPDAPQILPQDVSNVIYDAQIEREQLIESPDETLSPLNDSEGSVEGYSGEDGAFSEADEFGPISFGDMTTVNPGVFPWRMNAKLVMNFGGSFFVCSGAMIDAETVLTAGHCVYDFGGVGWADEIWVYPGWEGTTSANADDDFFGRGYSTSFLSNTGWTGSGNFDWDLGVVRINRAVGALTGWFGYAWDGSCSFHLSQNYHNASYPAESCPISGLHNGRDMYYWSGSFDSCVGSNQLQIDTSGGCFNAGWGGMSGSGAYYFDANSDRFVHGVASNSNRSTRIRYARLYGNLVTGTGGVQDFIAESRGTTFDLQALDMNVQPTAIQAGGSTTLLNHLAANPTNDSDTNTYSFEVYLSTNDNISTVDTLLSTQNYSRTFSAMQNVRVNMVMVTVPINTPPGTYWLGVVYDCATDGVCDNNDTDAWDAVQIQVTASPPDLITINPGVSDTTLDTGQNFTALATVQNQGGSTSASTTLRFYHSTNSIISTADTQIGTDAVASLSPGSTSPESNTVTAPTTPGTYWIGACVDVVSGESNTNNNCSTGVQITASTPDRTLMVTAPTGGTITGTGINCGSGGSDCSQSYTNGASVSLTANPDSGWSFDAWGGDCSTSSTSSCTLSMTSDRSVSATFLVTYTDVPAGHLAHDAITDLSADGIIAGCDGDRFCPGQPLDRATLAQWLLSALEGGSYLPPFASGQIFNDVSASDFNADWIETLATRNITEGCTADGSRYCPSDLVSRASLSALLLKTRYGSAYSPAPASGTVFDDIESGDFHAAWIEDLWFKGITDGCDANRFCPGQPVTRAEGAQWLHRAFGP